MVNTAQALITVLIQTWVFMLITGQTVTVLEPWEHKVFKPLEALIYTLHCKQTVPHRRSIPSPALQTHA